VNGSIVWLPIELLYIIHDKQLAAFGGSPGIKDSGLIESAMARPRNLAAYGDPDLAELAAAYAHGLCKNHGFNDGNKRAGWMAARVFLRMNGYLLVVDPEEAVRAMEFLAGSSLTEEDFATWLRGRIAPL
jgi:death-on-curing protein